MFRRKAPFLMTLDNVERNLKTV